MSDAEETAPRVPAVIVHAIVAAQRLAQAVSHDGTHGQGWTFTSSEALIGACRGWLNEAGLAVISDGWRSFDRDGHLWHEEQYLVIHEDGPVWAPKPCVLPAIEAKGRALDRAMLGADTSILGYFLRNLLQISRPSEADEINTRDDSDYVPPERPKHQPQHTTEYAKPSAKPPSEWSAAEFRAFGKNSGRVADVKAKGQADQCIALAAEAGVPRDEARGWFTPPVDDDDGGPGIFPLRDGTLSAAEEERVFNDLGDAHAKGDEK